MHRRQPLVYHTSQCHLRRSQGTLLNALSGTALLQILARVNTAQEQGLCKQADMTMFRLLHISNSSPSPALKVPRRQQRPHQSSQQQSLPYKRCPCGKSDKQIWPLGHKALHMLQLLTQLSLLHKAMTGGRLQSIVFPTMKVI